MAGTPWGQSPEVRPGVTYVESLDARAKLATGALAVVMLATGYSLLVDLQLYQTMEGILDGDRAPFAEVQDKYDAHDAALRARTWLILACAVFFLLWFHRAWRNAIAMGVPSPSRTPREAVLWWFIPFANLVIPKMSANDIYRGSDPDMPYNDPSFGSRRVASLLHIWWAAWLVQGVLLQIARRAADVPNDAQGVSREARLFIASDLMTLVAAGLAIAVVLRITNMSEERRRRFPDRIPGAVGGAAHHSQDYAADRYAAPPQGNGGWTPQPQQPAHPGWTPQPQEQAYGGWQPQQPAAHHTIAGGWPAEPPPLYSSRPHAAASVPAPRTGSVPPPTNSQPPPSPPGQGWRSPRQDPPPPPPVQPSPSSFQPPPPQH